MNDKSIASHRIFPNTPGARDGDRRAVVLEGLHERFDRLEEHVRRVEAMLARVLEAPARKARWSAADGPDHADLEDRVRHLLEEDTAPGLVEQALAQARGRDPDVVGKAVAHVMLMRARGKPLDSASRMFWWAASKATPRGLEEGATPNFTQVEARIAQEQHIAAVKADVITAHVPEPPATCAQLETGLSVLDLADRAEVLAKLPEWQRLRVVAIAEGEVFTELGGKAIEPYRRRTLVAARQAQVLGREHASELAAHREARLARRAAKSAELLEAAARIGAIPPVVAGKESSS